MSFYATFFVKGLIYTIFGFYSFLITLERDNFNFLDELFSGVFFDWPLHILSVLWSFPGELLHELCAYNLPLGRIELFGYNLEITANSLLVLLLFWFVVLEIGKLADYTRFS